jgi:hypothetical protein
MKNVRRAILAVLPVLLWTAVLGWADEDPPGRVARLQYMSGSVSVQPHGNQDWVQGSLNTPLTDSDNIWTDKDSKAELNVGGGVLRMSSESSLTLTNVSDNTVQVELHQGTLNLHVQHLFGSEIYEVDTPNVAFTVQKSGDYRIDVDPNGDSTVVTVRKGEGDATGNGPAVRIKSDQQISFTNGNSLDHTVAEAPPYDGFDSWCSVRDRREDQSVSARYVSPGVIGYQDLDDYGVWREIPPYGPVWVPTHVEAGWAPYRYGHWAWVSPWGWTWIDDAPWGFAPFHYGRWVYYGGAWGWAPGPVYVTPVYAPALVAWFGGPTWGVSFGFGVGGGFGWCPLGWGEPFYPWYHHGYGYFRSVNITNTYITNINRYYGHPPNRFDHYANYRAPGAFTAVPSRTLQNGLPVQRTAAHLTRNDIRNVPLTRTVGLTPNRGAVLGTRANPTAIPPSRSFARPVVTRGTPAGRMNTPAMANNRAPRAGTNFGMQPGRRTTQGSNRSFGSTNSASTRYVPHPPNATMAQRSESGNMRAGNQNMPRSGFSPNGSNARHYVPRPPSSMTRTAENRPFDSGRTPGNVGRSGVSNEQSAYVPRPTGPVRSANQAYGRSEQVGRNYGASPAFRSDSTRGSRYGSSPSYRDASPSYRNYSPTPSYRGGESASAPSYRGGGYSSSPYGGGRMNSPSPSYGGGSPAYHSSAPSYRGGGGGGSYARSGGFGGGGGHYSGGGAGGRSSGGGHSGGHR